MNTKIPPSRAHANRSAFSLVEILVVIGIIGVLAAAAFPMVQRARGKAAEAKSVSAMKSVLQSASLYAGENNGQIPTMRWADETEILTNPPGGLWVANTFWGRLQPYLFPEIQASDQIGLRDQLRVNLAKLFGTQDLSKMTGTPFAGTRIYSDTSTLHVPFAFNGYLKAWNKWVTQLQIYSLPSTIYVTYGNGVFNEQDAEEYHPMAKIGQTVENNIYYLPSKQAIAGFLDGRVEFLTPPIAERMVKIDGTAQ